MGKFIKTRVNRDFRTFARPSYLSLTNEVLSIVGAIGGTPGLVASVNGRIGAVILTANDVSLGNVDNTSDLAKPISTATQTALNAKQDKNLSIVEYTSDSVLALTDASKLVMMNVGIANSLTVPLNSTIAFPIGTQILVTQKGSGQTTISAALGATINVSDARYKLTAQYAMCTLIKVGTDEWYLSGDLIA